MTDLLFEQALGLRSTPPAPSPIRQAKPIGSDRHGTFWPNADRRAALRSALGDLDWRTAALASGRTVQELRWLIDGHWEFTTPANWLRASAAILHARKAAQ